MKIKQKGFAAVELVVIVAALIIIGGVGLSLRHSDTTKKPPAATSNTAQKASTRTTDKVSTHTSQASGTSTTSGAAPVEKEGAVSGVFNQSNDASWNQPVAYIGVSVDNVKQVSKVEWYLTDFNASSLLNTRTTSSANNLNDNGGLYQFDWDISSLPAGTYRVVAKVYDKDGNAQVVKNLEGNPYLDLRVRS